MIKSVLITIFLILIDFGMCLAQPDPPPKEPIPIDGGLIYLILGGLAIGIKKIMDHRKKS